MDAPDQTQPDKLSYSEPQPYAAAVRKLLQGVIYHDDGKIWSQLRDYEWPVREYLAQIGLGLHLDQIGGFAYLYEATRDDDQQQNLPALTQRRALSFPMTLLLVLLRERLDEHEMRDLDGVPLLLNTDEMAEMLSVFMGDHPDARKHENAIGNSIKRLVTYGFLKDRKDGRYEVRTVIRAKIDADELSDIKAKLENYVRQDDAQDDDSDDEELA